MKEEILDIAKKIYHNHLTPETATNLLFDLFSFSGRSELLFAFRDYWKKSNHQNIDDAIKEFMKTNKVKQ